MGSIVIVKRIYVYYFVITATVVLGDQVSKRKPTSSCVDQILTSNGLTTLQLVNIQLSRENSKFKMADAEKYLGKFDRTSAGKYDEFLSELGVNFLLRKAATVSSPVFEVTYDAGSEEWLFKTSTTLKTMELKFKLGVEFEEKTPDGREVTAIVTKEGDTFVSIQTAKKEGEKSTKITREFAGDEVIVISQVIGSDLICTQKFKKQA